MTKTVTPVPFNQTSCQPIEVEYEFYLVGHGILDDRVYSCYLCCLLHEQYIRRQRFVFHLLSQSLQLRPMFLRLIHEGSLNVSYDHVDSNPVLDASWHDDICRDSALALA